MVRIARLASGQSLRREVQGLRAPEKHHDEEVHRALGSGIGPLEQEIRRHCKELPKAERLKFAREVLPSGNEQSMKALAAVPNFPKEGQQNVRHQDSTAAHHSLRRQPLRFVGRCRQCEGEKSIRFRNAAARFDETRSVAELVLPSPLEKDGKPPFCLIGKDDLSVTAKNTAYPSYVGTAAETPF